MKRSNSELALVPMGRTMTVLKIPQDELDKVRGFLSILKNFMQVNPPNQKAIVTIYAFFDCSCDFGGQGCDVMYFGLCGNTPFADRLRTFIANELKIQVRIEGSMPSDGASRNYHIQDGMLWVSDDIYSWSSIDIPPRTPTQNINAKPSDDEDCDEDCEEDCDEDCDESVSLPQQDRKIISQKPVRVRSDCSISTLIAKMEAAFDLPTGSVRIVNPNGNAMRSSSTVKRLKEVWVQ